MSPREPKSFPGLLGLDTGTHPDRKLSQWPGNSGGRGWPRRGWGSRWEPGKAREGRGALGASRAMEQLADGHSGRPWPSRWPLHHQLSAGPPPLVSALSLMQAARERRTVPRAQQQKAPREPGA